MRSLTLVLSAAGVIVALGATRVDGAETPLTPQEQRAAACAEQAKALEPGSRKAFLDACSAGPPGARPTAPPPDGREKATACAAQAKGRGLSGTAYHDFVESCAKG